MSIQNGTSLYSSLQADDMRLLTLHPGTSEDPIECHLEHQKRDAYACIPYEALSYTWGPQEPSQHILLNGRRFEVRQNLWTALSRVRSRSSVRYLWIDALCIDRQNLQERSAQVLTMSGIYRWATRVLAWLGDAGQDSDVLIDLLNDSKGDFGLVWPSPGQMCKPRVEVTIKTMATAVGAVYALCSRPYWRRVWIIQEILSASSLELYCGRKSLAWTHLGAAFASLKTISRRVEVDSTTPATLIHREWVHYHTLSQIISLRKLVDLCARCKSDCQDVRDQIYGVISIADDKKGLTPDYTKTSLELYVEFLQIFIPVYEENILREIFHALKYTRHIIFLVKQLNHLLSHPTWNQTMKCFLTYPDAEMIQRRLPTIRSMARIYFTSTTRVIDTSSVMNSENRKRHYPGGIWQVGTTKLNWDQLPPGRATAVCVSWCDLNEPDLHRTNFIGELYSRDLVSYTYTRVTEYEKGETADGHIRIFTTLEGSLGIASHKVEKHDLLCFSDASHQVCFIIRASAYPLSCASTFRLISQVIMLEPGPLSLEASYSLIPENDRFHLELSWETLFRLLR